MPLNQVDPATRPQPKGGQEARGKLLAGLGVEMLRIAIPMFPKESDFGITLAEVSAKLGKMFAKPPADLGQAELKFMGSQLYPQQQPQNAMDSGGGIQQKLMGMGAPAPAGVGGAPAGPQGG